MILIAHPSGYKAERLYIFDVLIKDFLGLDYEPLEHKSNDVHIMLSNDPNGRHIVLPDVIFNNPAEKWMTPDTLPHEPLEVFNVSETPIDALLTSSDVPVIFGRRQIDGSFLSENKTALYLGLDIFGSSFFMLTRYEEVVVKERDDHDRFSATDSLAYRENFLSRPIVNEYVELLWWALRWLSPTLKRKQNHYKVGLSHDVDWPMTDSQGLKHVALSAVADIVRRKDPGLAFRRLYSLPCGKSHRFDYDVNNTFDFIMDVSESHGLISTFFMISDSSDSKIDGTYSLDEAWVKNLLKDFNMRGHRIGLHLSYNSFRDKDKSSREFERLMSVCDGLNIKQSSWGSRQHFLRWENPTTWQNVEDTGVAYDTTLTFADSPGFRCGVCNEYRVFNLRKRKALTVKERPLIVMEGTLFDYMGVPYEEAFEIIVDLSRKCRMFGGEFTLLWHNSSLITRQSKRWYKEIVKGIQNIA